MWCGGSCTQIRLERTDHATSVLLVMRRSSVRLRQAKARAEVTADAATQAGQVRQGMRYLRYGPELRPEDLPALPGREVL